MKDVELPEEIDLSGSGNLYQFIPLRLFTETRHLNLSSTSISNRHFQQIATVAKNLERLDNSNCPGLDQICIFQAKKDLDQLRHVDISWESQVYDSCYRVPLLIGKSSDAFSSWL